MPETSDIHLQCRVEDGLINHESPFCGSKRFGISHVSSEGGVCQVGTLLKIEGHKRLPDGQITTFNRGLAALLTSLYMHVPVHEVVQP